MAKQQVKPTLNKNKQKEFGFSFDKFIPEKYKTPALLLLLLLLIFAFFSPILLGDKTTSSYDLTQSKSLRQYAVKERDGNALWNPYIFCGIPAVVTTGSPRWFDLTNAVYSCISLITQAVTKDFNATFVLSFIVIGFATFFLMRGLGFSRSISFFTALAMTFSTGITVLFYIGHISKLKSLALFPFILLMLFRFQKKIKLIDVLLLVLGIHLLALSAHVQIVFYFALLTAVYFIYFFIRSFVTKDKPLQIQLLKSAAIFVGATVIALLMSYDTYSQILEYKPYSTRGTQSITETHSTGATQNNSYEYATGWSFSPGEVLTFIIPSYYGFGNSTYTGPLTNGQPAEVNTYFGQMRFVDTAMYMGVIIFALGLFALYVKRKEPIIQFLGIVVVLFLLMSFGNNFPLVYNLFYYYFPMFDNFRAPSMILHIIQIIFPVLAGYGVMHIVSLKKEKNHSIEKGLKYIAIVFGVLFFITLIAGDAISSSFTNRVTEFTSGLGTSQQAQLLNALATDYTSKMFSGDVQIAMALLALTFGLSYAYAASKINKQLLIAGLTVFCLFDLFRISSRGANYTDIATANEGFGEPEYISVIKAQNEKDPYRLINIKQDGSSGSVSNNGNFNVYFLQEDFYGYSAAKPRSFQDMMDVIGNPANFTLWRMLGVKYIVTDRPFNPPGFTTISSNANTIVTRYDKALPRVYFVDSVAENSSVNVLKDIRDDKFDPKHVAYVEKLDFKFDKCDSTSTSKIIEYKDEHVTTEVKAKGNNFFFHGATYLPGWKAYVDGIETKVHKTNSGFQGIVVPQGNHKIEFVYKPNGFIIGKYMSLLLNILLFGGIGAILFFSKRKKSKQAEAN
jgi:hypothetical protein